MRYVSIKVIGSELLCEKGVTNIGRERTRIKVFVELELEVPCEFMVFINFPGGSAVKESTCNAGDMDLIPGLGRYPGEGNSYPLQYSGLENLMDCIVHGVTMSQT